MPTEGLTYLINESVIYLYVLKQTNIYNFTSNKCAESNIYILTYRVISSALAHVGGLMESSKRLKG